LDGGYVFTAVGLSVYLLARLLKKFLTDFDKTLYVKTILQGLEPINFFDLEVKGQGKRDSKSHMKIAMC